MDDEKGTPFRRAKERARYLLEDFSDFDCRNLLLDMIEGMTNKDLLDAIVGYWEDVIEPELRDLSAKPTACATEFQVIAFDTEPFDLAKYVREHEFKVPDDDRTVDSPGT